MNYSNILFYNGDISDNEKEFILKECEYIGIDTETTGLNPLIDNLCIIQIAAKEYIFVINYNKDVIPLNIIEILKSEKVCKVFHHANFDIRFLIKNLNINEVSNVVCTKIAAKLLYGLKEKNSLKNLLDSELGVVINKKQQLSDWSKQNLTDEQIEYASNDVKYLVELWLKLRNKLEFHNQLFYAQRCYEFLPIQAYLQNKGIDNIFSY